MSVLVDPRRVNSVLLADGWRVVSESAFGVGDDGGDEVESGERWTLEVRSPRGEVAASRVLEPGELARALVDAEVARELLAELALSAAGRADA